MLVTMETACTLQGRSYTKAEDGIRVPSVFGRIVLYSSMVGLLLCLAVTSIALQQTASASPFHTSAGDPLQLLSILRQSMPVHRQSVIQGRLGAIPRLSWAPLRGTTT